MAPRFHFQIALLPCMILAMGIAVETASADLLPIAWDGGASTSEWIDAFNWDLDVVPDNDETNEFDVTIEAADVDLSSTDVTISGLAIGDTASLSIGDCSLTMTGGSTITNRNVITSDVDAMYAEILVDGGDLTLTGGGTIIMHPWTYNYITGTTYTDRIINEDNTIRGLGDIGDNVIALTNRGTIIADGPGPLTIDPGFYGVVNSGLLKAAEAATLNLSRGVYTNFEGNDEGQIVAGAAGQVRTSEADFAGGSIEVEGDGSVRLYDTFLIDMDLLNSPSGTISIADAWVVDTDITNPAGGRIIIENGRILDWAGSQTFTNAGEITLDGQNAQSLMRISDGELTIAGGGVLTLAGARGGRITGLGPNNPFTNQDNTIHGSGYLTLALTNRGTIVADAENPLNIVPGVLSCTNSGIMKAANGSTLLLQGREFLNFEDDIAGHIVAEDGGTIQLESTSITGGRIDVQGAGLLTLNHATITDATLANSNAGEIVIVGDSTIDATVINPVGGRIVVDNLRHLTLGSSGTYTNAGEILIGTGEGFARIIVEGDAVTLSGGGVVTLADTAGYWITGAQYGDRLINEDNTIHGGGYMGTTRGLGLTNRGTIIADGITELSLRASPQAGTVNSGTMKAAGGSMLRLSASTFANAEDGNPGHILAEDGGIVRLPSCEVVGGEIAVQGNGLLELVRTTITEASITNSTAGTIDVVESSTIDADLINPAGGLLRVNHGKSLTLASTGTYTNAGEIALNEGGRGSSLRIAGDAVTITGGGVISLNDSQITNAQDASGPGRLINEDNTIRGGGYIGVGQLALLNRGTISVSGQDSLQIQPAAFFGGFDNQGRTEAIDGGQITINSGDFTTSGQVHVADDSLLYRDGDYLQTAGSTIVNGLLTLIVPRVTADEFMSNDADERMLSSSVALSELLALHSLYITGMLGGSGVINGNVIHEGEGSVAPGAGVGTLTINGVYEQSPTTLLEIELGGTGQGASDKLAVSGNAMLDGVLSVSLVDGFYPEPGQVFEILTAAQIDGAFNSLVLVNIPSPLMVGVIYQANRVLLAFGAIPGLGACCHADGSCEVIAESSCDLPDDLFSPGEPCSPYTCPGLVECCTGDVNGDQLINGLDVEAFVAGLLNPPMPGTVPFCRLDANGDRLDVDIDDVMPFVTLLLDGAMCEISCCPGDVNGDNMLNGSDIAPLEDAIDNPPPRGTIEFCRADVNEDLFVNNADASALALKLLMGETCPGSELSLRQVIEEAKLRAAESASMHPASE